jgi:predicted ATPase/DNA-binding SARP family transcriptional activator/DNA-binding CsgD family transcriptional regulator
VVSFSSKGLTRREERSRKEPEVVRVWLLGGFRVSVGSRTIDENQWRLRKASGLIKLLALAPGHRLHRERVMDLLWPDLDARAAANNLNQVLHHARRTLAPANAPGASRHLLLREEQVALCPDAPLWVDVETFQKASTVARRAREPAAYRAAIELYSGELLPEDRYEEWTESRRQELRRTFLALLLELAGLYEERGAEEDLAPAVQALQRALAEEPSNEEAHVGLMRLYASSGRSGEALRQYARLSEALSTELVAEPSVSTRALSKEIAAGRFPATPTQPAGPPTEETAGGRTRHNLPAQRSSFVNRERERVELKRDLAMTRLLTLTGSGGTGKTRLAQEVAKDLVGAYPDGVLLVQLAGLSEPELVAHVVAATVGVRERPGRPLSATLAEELRTKNVLLVVDNCEHLIEAVASLTDELMGACPKVRILATSREPLRMPGEVVRRVPPLPVPGPDDPALLSKEGLARFAVTRLFLERAPAWEEDPTFSAGSVQAVARVCRRLEGIPLAIELAAARTATLSVEQIEERLEDSLKLLTTGFRSADPRHQTLRATLDWSYALLSEAEQVLFGRLFVFAGGWTLEAAEAVGSSDGVGEGDVLDPLSRLVDKSLVAVEEGEHGVMRYTMLEPVRQYAREKLRESAEEDAVQRRHAGFFLALAEEAEPELAGTQQQAWLKRLEREHANLRGALAWALDTADSIEPREHRTELGLRLAGALGRFWGVYGPGEGRRWLEKGLAKAGAASKPTLAKACYEAGWIESFQGDYDRAISLLEEGLALFRELGDRRGVATSLVNLGFALLHLGDQERATMLRQEVEALRGEPLDRWTLAWLTTFLALATLYEGDYERSGALATESLAIYRELGDKRGVSLCHIDLGFIELARGNHEPAAGLLEESVRVLRGSEDKFCLAYGVFGLAAVAAARAEPGCAARLWGAAKALREEIGVVSLTQWELHVYDYEGRVSAARNMLGDEGAWERAWAEGRAMTPDQAVEYALSEEVARATESPPADRRTVDPLTRREREVAALVVRGLTNRQIAKELEISERTVDKHVTNLLKKLNLLSREQVAVRMAERRAQLS